MVVVGWGALAPAPRSEARHHGAEVLVIDRFEGGGASALSGGVVCRWRHALPARGYGFPDTPEAMFDYLRREVNGAVSDDTLKRFCDDSAANLAWLGAAGRALRGADAAHQDLVAARRLPPGKLLRQRGGAGLRRPAPAGAARPPHAGQRARPGATLYAACNRPRGRRGARAAAGACGAWCASARAAASSASRCGNAAGSAEARRRYSSNEGQPPA